MEYVDQIEYVFQKPSSGDPFISTTNHKNTPIRTQHQQNPNFFPLTSPTGPQSIDVSKIQVLPIREIPKRSRI